MRRVKHARTVSLTVVLACVVGTMAVGTALKTPCAGGNYDGRQYRLLCYSDIVPLLGTEQLGHGRLPFLDRCAETGNNCDEYPVLTMYLMRMAAWISGDHYGSFYYVNAVLLTVFAPGSRLASMDARGETCALVRPRPDAPHLRHDELGPASPSC